MVHAGAAYGGCLTILALSGQRCTWTTAVIAYAATAAKIERCSSDSEELQSAVTELVGSFSLELPNVITLRPNVQLVLAKILTVVVLLA